MSAYQMLSEPIRKYIRNKKWTELRSIQSAAIIKIMSTNSNYILASRTASGKTEAAFLPILSKINISDQGVQVLYISPLIALINDQFYRIEELCNHLDCKVTKWHGEANKTEKSRLLKNPSGVLLITPESIEAMFVNNPNYIKQLFSNLKYIVIDEIHSFIGTSRGIQLKSLLSRLQQFVNNRVRIIGLSATLGDYDSSKIFTGNPDDTVVLLDDQPKDIITHFKFFSHNTSELSLNLIKDLYLATKDYKVLIFPNSRGRTEEVAVKLKKLSDKLNGHSNYFSHHSSVNKDVRQYVENFAKNKIREKFSIVCTSTLELGIDIGEVDSVFQIDSTHSISSLVQRVGRSGRKDGKSSQLYLYATNKWSLLQSLACWFLYKDSIIEPPEICNKPYDVLLHQILSITRSNAGIEQSQLIHNITNNFAFSNIEIVEIKEIIDHLLQIDFLEKINNELIIGLCGERIVNNMEFYSVFQREYSLKVFNSGVVIGEVAFTPQIIVGENIFLAAKIWTIIDVDLKANRIEVSSANDGRKPIFLGCNAKIHPIIRERMLSILCSSEQYKELDSKSQDEINQLRDVFKIFKFNNPDIERPLMIKPMSIQFFTFAGTKVNSALKLLFKISGIRSDLDELDSSIIFESNTISTHQVITVFKNMIEYIPNIDVHLTNHLTQYPELIKFSKYGSYLPIKYQISLLKEIIYDFESASSVINRWVLKPNA